MNGVGLAFLVTMLLAQWMLPKRYAVVPLLLTFGWMTRGQVIELGDINISLLRFVIVVALARAMADGRKPAGGINGLDIAWLMFATWMVASAAFHTDVRLGFRLGLVWDYVGSYAVLRLFVQDEDDARRMFKAMGLILLPVSVAMLAEKSTGENYFASLGGVSAVAHAGDNGLRAAGPFTHPLLSGTVGATLIPLAIALWPKDRRAAIACLASGSAIVFASASSGPYMMAFIGLLVLAVWRMRSYTAWLAWGTVFMLVVLHMVMKDPVYFLFAKIDVVGGSTGWHRAQLIHASVQQIDEWWVAGTDYTRHWMPTGIPDNDRHTDITNHYLAMGVLGGLPLLLMFVAIVCGTLRYSLQSACNPALAKESSVFAWTIFAVTFGHAINFLSCSLFDQSIVSFIVLTAAAGALRTVGDGVAGSATEGVDERPAPDPTWGHLTA